jgi:hypothetical protein
MGAAGERRVHDHFSSERMVNDTLDLYKRVCMHAHVESA